MSQWTIGLWVTFGVVLLPLYMVLLGWFTGKPRDLKTAGIGVGYMVAIAVAILVGLWILGLIAGLIIPA
jgi:hypothetical protein